MTIGASCGGGGNFLPMDHPTTPEGRMSLNSGTGKTHTRSDQADIVADNRDGTM